MSFEQEPQYRRLFYHAESDSLFVETNPARVAEFSDNCELEDVTGEPKFEKLFAERKNK
jgi:hypothetical protein